MTFNRLVYAALIYQVCVLVVGSDSAAVSSQQVDEVSISRRIFGGKEKNYKYDELRFIVKLTVISRTRMTNGTRWSWNCTGSLLSDRVILSTRDCLFRNNRKPSRVVITNSYYNSVYVLEKAEASGSEVHVFPCDSVVTNCSETHNLALIQIPRTVAALSGKSFYTRNYPSLPDMKDNSWIYFMEKRQTALIGGWGDTGSGKPLYLHTAEVNKIANSDCEDYYDVNIGNDYFCIRMEQIGTCLGDEGGPLLIREGSYKSSYFSTGLTQVGVNVKHPNFCGDEDSPSLYLNLLPYVSWIKLFLV